MTNATLAAQGESAVRPFLEILIRTVLAYLSLIVLTRLIGRRELNQLTFPDFASSLAIGTIAGSLSIGQHKGTLQLMFSLMVWAVLTIAVDWASLHHRGFRVLVDGGPTVIIENGKILEHRMRNLRYSVDDLLAMLREQGVFRLADVEFAVMEPGGKLSVLKKSQLRPVTPADLAIPTQYEGVAVTLLVDGKIHERNLKLVGLDRHWLLTELSRRKLDPAEVFLAQLDTSGHLYIDLRDEAAPGT